MTPKIAQFVAETKPATPCLIVDLDVVEERFLALQEAMPSAKIHYAVKANPAAPVLETLARLDSCFDAASLAEIRLCLAAGARAEAIIFGNTIKKREDIERAGELGVSLFAFDCEQELEKIAAAVPGAKVYGRMYIDDTGAGWPIGRKFGTSPEILVELLVRARDLGLVPYGVSFHVGSQQTDTTRWEVAVAKAAMVFTALEAAGIELKMIDLGGGIPVRYRKDVPDIQVCTKVIGDALTRAFGNRVPDILIEPGRVITAAAGVMLSEVVLVATRNPGSEERWVYLDIGKFGGLAECMDESITYDIRSDRDDHPMGPVILAGPTCDGADILYEKSRYELPLDLTAGDRVEIRSAGAYTSTYAAAGFNGFSAPHEYYL